MGQVPKTSRSYVGIAAAMVFVFLAVDVSLGGPISHLDLRVFRALNPAPSGWLLNGSQSLAKLGSWPVQTLLLLFGVLVVTVVYRSIIPLFMAVFSLVLLAALGFGSKELFGRLGPRDFPAHMGWGGSFPSGHATAAVVVGCLLALLVGRSGRPLQQFLARTAAAIWAASVGLSRIYLGVHWLSDVLAGWALGIVVVCITIAVTERLTSGKQNILWSRV